VFVQFSDAYGHQANADASQASLIFRIARWQTGEGGKK
jgi:hypothetical protein